MNKEEFNTDFLSPERIWVEKEVDSLWYNNNDRETYNSLESTIKFLKTAEKKAKKGFIKVRVEPHSEDCENSLPHEYIKVKGYRQETDLEYKTRIQNEVNRMKRTVENTERTHRYHFSKNFSDKLKLWESKL